jgi:hypothetical protein
MIIPLTTDEADRSEREVMRREVEGLDTLAHLRDERERARRDDQAGAEVRLDQAA